jgi:hypothetical protein
MYIASREDMIILKLISLRDRDIEDVRLLLDHKVDYRYLNLISEKLGVKDILKQDRKSHV